MGRGLFLVFLLMASAGCGPATTDNVSIEVTFEDDLPTFSWTVAGSRDPNCPHCIGVLAIYACGAGVCPFDRGPERRNDISRPSLMWEVTAEAYTECTTPMLVSPLTYGETPNSLLGGSGSPRLVPTLPRPLAAGQQFVAVAFASQSCLAGGPEAQGSTIFTMPDGA